MKKVMIQPSSADEPLKQFEATQWERELKQMQFSLSLLYALYWNSNVSASFERSSKKRAMKKWTGKQIKM